MMGVLFTECRDAREGSLCGGEVDVIEDSGIIIQKDIIVDVPIIFPSTSIPERIEQRATSSPSFLESNAAPILLALLILFLVIILIVLICCCYRVCG